MTPPHTKRIVFYGWVIVLAAAGAEFFSGPGQTYSVSIFVDPMLREFGWSRSVLSALYSSASLVAGFAVIVIGRLIDSHGHRRVLTVVVLAFGGACLLMSGVSGPVTLFAGFFLIRLLGQGSMTMIAITLIPHWFEKTRGRALAFTALGMAAGSATLPLSDTWFIGHWGWRGAWQFWAAALWIIMLPVAYFVVRNRPADLGLAPDNQPLAADTTKTTHDGTEGFTLREAMRTRIFWLLLTVTMFPPLISTGLTFHLVSIMGHHGVDPKLAATIFTISAVAYVPCSLAAGFVGERVAKRFLVAAWLTLQVLQLVWLLGANVGTEVLIIGFGALNGMVQAVGLIVSGTLWADYFGRRYLGSIQGMASSAMVIGAALGPLPFGMGYDHWGTYSPVLLVLAGLELAAAIAVTLAPARARLAKVDPTVYSRSS